jgi:ATPase subunit of ABC transporter with duplicated ATPase domains
MTAAIVCSDLSFSWPDGAPVLSGLTASFGPGRTGLIGLNGSGKSTLLRLIAGDLHPGDGLVRACGEVGYLPQAITLGTRCTVSDLLGITTARNALQALEGYRGAILVASHDVPFLRSAGITRWLRLDRDAGLAEISPQ